MPLRKPQARKNRLLFCSMSNIAEYTGAVIDGRTQLSEDRANGLPFVKLCEKFERVCSHSDSHAMCITCMFEFRVHLYASPGLPGREQDALLENFVHSKSARSSKGLLIAHMSTPRRLTFLHDSVYLFDFKGFSIFPIMRLILPQLDRERSAYGIKIATMSKCDPPRPARYRVQ